MQENNQPKVRVRNLTKQFGDLLVLNDISFDVQPGEFCASWAPPAAARPPF